MSKILFSAPLATAVLAVGLLVSVPTASAVTASALDSAAAVAVPASSVANSATDASAKGRNLLSNPSFERGTFGWKASHGRLANRSERKAPDGKRVAEVSVAKKAAKSARLTAKTQAVSQAGQRYQATAHVAAGNKQTIGKKARLVLRELDGQKVVSQRTGRKVTLKSSFRNVVARAVAKGSGNRLEVFVEIINPRRGNAFHADDIRLEVRRPSGQPLGAGGPVNGLLSITLGQEEHWGDTSQYGTMVVYGWEADRIDEIKARNPNTRVLMYVEAGATYRRTDCSSVNNPQSFQVSHASWGVDMCWMLANGHDDWVLRNSDGSYAEFTDYGGFLLMDMANPAFAKEWARNMVQAATSMGFDGVWADDVNTRVGHGLSNIHRETGSNLEPVSDAQYGDGTVSWARKVQAEMDSMPGGKSLTFAANVFADPWDPTASAQALKIAKSLDLFNKEHQAQWTVGLSCGPFKSMEPAEINAIMDFARRIQDTGASYSAIDYGGGPLTDRDRQVMTFGRSMFLLGWNGNPGAAYFFRPCGSVDPADTRWTTELGAPTGAVETLRTEWVRLPGQTWDQEAHVLKRDFALGLVLQNQLPFAVTVPLDGTYKTQDGRTVSGSITIPGATWFKAGSSYSQPAEQGLPGGAALLTRVG